MPGASVTPRRVLSLVFALGTVLAGFSGIVLLAPRVPALKRVLEATPRISGASWVRGPAPRHAVEYAIPRILHMTHYKDLLHADASELDASEAILAENVARTVGVLGDWADEVMFWTDETCIEAAMQLPHGDVFIEGMRTMSGMYIADVCRGIALWLHGGLYLDADVVIRESATRWLDPGTDFVTAKEASGTAYFQAILGSVPRHPTISLYLDVLKVHLLGSDVIHEKLGRGHFQWMGPVAMARAVERSLDEDTAAMQVLQEYKQSTGKGLREANRFREGKDVVEEPIPDIMPGETGCCCDFIVCVQTTPSSNTTHRTWRPVFHSRVALPSSTTCNGTMPFRDQMAAVGLQGL